MNVKVIVDQVLLMIALLRWAFALVAVLGALSGNRTARAENWPQWRGPTNNAVSSETGLPTKWSKTDHVAWRLALPGQSGATPIVWNDRIFLSSADGDN